MWTLAPLRQAKTPGVRRLMNCQEARESFSMLLDGELGLTERVPLELHVNACEGCQRRLEHLRELRELEQRARPAPRPVHWRPILAPGFVVKALGAIRAEDVTTRLRRLVAEKVPSRQLAVAVAVPLLVMLAVFIFERGFTVGWGMRQRPVAVPAETRSEAPVVPPVASIAPAPPTIATPVVPTRVAPPPAVVTQPAAARGRAAQRGARGRRHPTARGEGDRRQERLSGRTVREQSDGREGFATR